MAVKECRKCNIIKPIEEFSRDKKSIDNHTHFCKQCIHNYYIDNKEKMNEQSKKRYYAESKEQRAKRIKTTKDWEKNNTDYYTNYYIKNKEKWKRFQTEEKRKYNKEWRLKNKEHVREYNRNYLGEKLKWQDNKMKTDPKFRVDRAMSTAIRNGVQGKGGERWADLVDFTKEELHAHIEALFTDGMSWDNFSEWHIDHVIPKSWFSYNSVKDDNFKLAWSLYNLQPLWAEDNLRKGNSFAGRV